MNNPDIKNMAPPKYRGHNGTEWVYGYYEYDEQLNVHLIRKNGVVHQINPDSLGHFIGIITEKDKKELYSGDIVQAWSAGSHATFTIKWRQAAAPLYLLYPAWQNREMWQLHGSCPVPDDGNFYDSVVIIGNEFENPDLKK